MMLPVELVSEESPRLMSSSEMMPFATSKPPVTPAAAPTMKAKDSFTASFAVTKMIADMICGPAIIVMASGTTCRFTSRV